MNLNFASSFYWFIECEATSNNEGNEISEIFKNIKQYFIEEIQNSMFFSIIENEIKFTEELQGITSCIKNLNKFEDPKKKLKDIINRDKKDFMYNNEHYLPIDPKIKIKGIDVDDCQIFNSATKPIKFSFKITQDTMKYSHFSEDNKNSKYSKFFFKCGDDLRQDQLILQIINFMNSLLKKMQLDYKFTIYKVLATNNNEGFVEFVPESITYSKILTDYKRLELYFKAISENQKDHKKYIDNYINSLAGYCAVNYILGIGDRHNENLMFDKKGKLFHIDFGYILNNDPKIYYKFKLTQDMVDLIGGIDSEKYKIFKQKCVNAYLILRDNARTIINMFYLMIDSGIPQLNIEQIKKLFENFQLDLTKENAAKSFQDELDLTLNRVLPQILEMGHALNQKWQNLF
jgi:phosphatidylinositol kinase/protein kinase (PI-3  family)